MGHTLRSVADEFLDGRLIARQGEGQRDEEMLYVVHIFLLVATSFAHIEVEAGQALV